MVKTITTPSGNEIKLSNAAAFLIVYKNQFGREPLKDLLKFQKATESHKGDDFLKIASELDLDILYNLAWTLAKLGNFNRVKDPIKFFIENDDFLPLDHVDDIIEMVMGSLSIDMVLEVEQDEKN